MASKIELKIANPCSENWDQMDRTEKGRYCQACQKQVIDFTGMSDQQLALFFKSQQSQVCGRLRDDQLARELNIPRKRIHWFRYFLQVAIPAMIFSNKGYTQGKVITRPSTIVLQQQRDSIEEKIRTDMHVTIGDTVAIRSGPQPYVPDVLTGLVGGISVVKVKKKRPARSARRVLKETKDLVKCVKDSMAAFFRIYPNPVASGGSLNIELTSQLKEGYYNLEISAMDGKRVYTRNELWIDKGARILNLGIPALTAGNYVLVLRGRKDGKGYSQMIMIK